MKIALINGSPKVRRSASIKILNQIETLLGKEFDYTHLHPMEKVTIDDAAILNGMDVLVFAFPLYFDGIPGHLLDSLQIMEKHFKANTSNKTVYVVVNAGFFEGKQCINAIALMKNWAKKANLTWGVGLGIGAGAMLAFLESVPLGSGPRKAYGKALIQLTSSIKNKESFKDCYISPNFIRRLYIILVHRGWYKMGKKNNNSKIDLNRSQL